MLVVAGSLHVGWICWLFVTMMKQLIVVYSQSDIRLNKTRTCSGCSSTQEKVNGAFGLYYKTKSIS